jgi:hypothetical protein
VDSVGKLVLKLGRGLRYDVSMDMSKERREVSCLPSPESFRGLKSQWREKHLGRVRSAC